MTELRAPASSLAKDEAHWYRDAIIYELHVRAFCDSDGDGIGDFRGLVSKLDYLQDLGVNALWLLPFYPSPLRDDGYDIAEYRNVHPSYGTLRDFRWFMREAHRRGMKVITELVLAHTSDQHPWFQRARRSPPGSGFRDFYIWSDTPDRFGEARVIFKDFEGSNWTWDPVAQAYFWHRFYSHQPALNYDNPAVEAEIFSVVDFWLGMGVDGLRLDAVPYLFAREGTSCENLLETFAFLRRLRAHIDGRFPNRMLLAEANQWPEDAVRYMGNGDVCHMAFHFPLMPRIFMAARQEDRFPIIDILQETPEAPPGCQWALFLRNHDELTLEMVTDEERDYMYRAYAQDPQARVNVGIRRRLAPLLGGNRRLIEMMNGLLFSLPGTPIIYYGDEIGMGDNIYLGDRNAVRTPMQWGTDRNAGFSRANPQKLYLPVVIDPEYQPQAVNVESQLENPSSLLWWMTRLVALRKRHPAFSRGGLQILRGDNRKVLAFLRTWSGSSGALSGAGPGRVPGAGPGADPQDEQTILVVVNLSRYAQSVQLDLSDYRNCVPVELFGGAQFPAVGDLPYFVTLGPYGFYWFALTKETESDWAPRPSLEVGGTWEEVFKGPSSLALAEAVASFVSARRWFRDKARRITSTGIVDAIVVPSSRKAGIAGVIAFVEVELDAGEAETYVLPLAWAAGEKVGDVARFHPDAVVAVLRAQGQDGVLYDALWEPEFCQTMLDLASRRRQLVGSSGRLAGSAEPSMRRLLGAIAPGSDPVPVVGEQSNSSVVFGDQIIMKVIRRLERGLNPAVELGRFLERARFPHAPRLAGAIEYVPTRTRPKRHDQIAQQIATLATFESYAPNEGDGWSYAVDALRHGLEEALARHDRAEVHQLPPSSLLDAIEAVEVIESGELASDNERTTFCSHPLVSPHREWVEHLGARTAELHLALASATHDSDMAPLPFSAMDRQALYHGARALLKRTLRQARSLSGSHHVLAKPLLEALFEREEEISRRLRRVTEVRIEAQRIRVHGDYHLGQTLWTGRDFVIIDFEGEPARSIGQRRLKRPALVDVAGMIRSFHYASKVAGAQVSQDMVRSEELEEIESMLVLWYRAVAAIFLRSYLDTAKGALFLPKQRTELEVLLDFFLLEKAIYELGYEINSRPDWAAIPAAGILDLLGSPG